MGSIVYAIVGFIEFILVFRFVFRLVGANAANGFVSWIYSISSPLIIPFAGILGQPPVVEGVAQPGVFEFATVVAIIVYGLAGGLLARLFAGIGRRNETKG